jgi:hypothetical protein
LLVVQIVGKRKLSKPTGPKVPLPLELNEILKKLPRKGGAFDARNLRKSFRAACVKVGLGVERGPKVWSVQGPAASRLPTEWRQEFDPVGGSAENRHENSGHLTGSAFERYNIVDSTDLHEAMAKVEKYFDGNLMAVEENQ